MTGKTRVVLSDDHPILLAGLRNLIEAEDDLELVGEAANGIAALKIIREMRPDVAILDISMPELNGIMVARRLAEEAPSVKLMVLTLHEDRAYLKQALDVGVRGYVLKRSAAENLVHAIRAVVVGGLYVDPAIVGHVFDKACARGGRPAAKTAMPELTEREAEVLKLAALGFTNKETARRIDVGVKSVETYKARGLDKLGLKTRAELVRFASAQGWLADL
ncbi:MAG: response regulator transcription factor [Rhizobiales bacterium]|nr:response regulator transcription factor [Hyphomicrobiales bacterium]